MSFFWGGVLCFFFSLFTVWLLSLSGGFRGFLASVAFRGLLWLLAFLSSVAFVAFW